MTMLLDSLLHVNKAAKSGSQWLFGNSFDPEKDIVLVTGGNGGLGRQIIEAIVSKKAKAICLDIKLPEEEDRLEGVNYYECDVGDSEEIRSVYERIKVEVGTVTVLVNNAGIVGGKCLLDMGYDQVDKIIRVNLLSSFYTIKTFLPDMIEKKRGYIVTIGSVLGYMSPARLSAYGASKSGLLALHESLTYELGSPIFNQCGVKTLLLCPGQLRTNMFKSVTTPSKLLAPELDPGYVAKYLVKSIELGRRGEIKIPLYGNIIPVFRAFPWPVVQIVRTITGIDRSMQAYQSAVSSLKSARSSLQSIRSVSTCNSASSIMLA